MPRPNLAAFSRVAGSLCLAIYLTGTLSGLPVIQATQLTAGSIQPEGTIGRVVTIDAGTRIDRVLRPTDSVITVERIYMSPSMRPRPGSTLAEWKTTTFPVVMIATILDLTGTPTRAGDWIETRSTARIDEVITAPEGLSVAAGMNVAVVTTGGVATIDGRLVLARLPGFRALRRNQAYLLFCSFESDGSLRAMLENIYELHEGSISTLVEERPDDRITQLGNRTQVLETVREHARTARLKK